MNDKALVDMSKVNDLAERIAEFLPQSRTLPKDTRLTIAQIALAHRLDPFLGDIWAIPERQKVDGNWQTTGYRIMIGISAWRRSAHDTGEYWGRRYEKCTDEERKWLQAGPNDLAIKCIVMRRKTGQQPMEFDGFGIFKQGEPSKMNPLQCVRLRAERDALKGAFPIGFGGGAVKIGVADDTGTEINGEIDHGVKWDVITSEHEDAPAPIIQVTEAPDTQSELIAAAEAALKSGVLSVEDEPERLRDAVSNAKAEAPRKTFRIASVKFNGMTADQWNAIADGFANEHTNWQKNGHADMQHILISAGNAGYETITGDNIDQVFAAIVAAHEEKQAH